MVAITAICRTEERREAARRARPRPACGRERRSGERILSSQEGSHRGVGRRPGPGEHASDADLRVRLHELRPAVRGAHRPQLRRGSREVSCLRRSRRRAPRSRAPRRPAAGRAAAARRPRAGRWAEASSKVARSGDPHLHTSRIPRTSDRGDPAVHSRAPCQGPTARPTTPSSSWPISSPARGSSPTTPNARPSRARTSSAPACCAIIPRARAAAGCDGRSSRRSRCSPRSSSPTRAETRSSSTRTR